MQGQWYYGAADQRVGPVSIEQLQGMYAAGQITPQTMCWSAGMPQWVAAATLPFIAAGRVENSAGLNLLLPIGPQSGLAIAAGYLGLFSLVFGVTAPLGIIFGVLALRDLRAHPEKRGKGRALTGIIIGSLITVVWVAILGVALASRH
jgi:hypothetical protein